MGSCCSCFGRSNDGEVVTQEMEMQAKKAAKSLAIARNMTAPTVEIGTKSISGTGLALAGAALEQDAAYWEWHISLPARTHVDTILFGVSAKKDRKFYKGLEDMVPPEEGVSSQVNGTQFMRRVEVQDNDVIGVAMQQSDLPMVQFFLNKEPLYEASINRFRGTVYPAICLPESAAETLKVTLVLNEKDFKHPSPGQRFLPVILARSIV